VTTRATPRSFGRRWVTACVVAEAIGMTASAGAARGATALVDADVARAALLGFLMVVAGGLVEGTALGVLQAGVLAERLGRRGRRAWVAVTLALAGLGWAIGSAPATLSADPGDNGAAPPLAAVLAGAAGIGLVLGALLGAAQAWVLTRRAARPASHPGRWVLGSALGWTVAMTVIFGGATTAGAGWAWPLVAGYGTVTGALAGLGLGLVTAPFLARLHAPAQDLGPEPLSPRPMGVHGVAP
jgi:MFS family permease